MATCSWRSRGRASQTLSAARHAAKRPRPESAEKGCLPLDRRIPEACSDSLILQLPSLHFPSSGAPPAEAESLQAPAIKPLNNVPAALSLSADGEHRRHRGRVRRPTLQSEDRNLESAQPSQTRSAFPRCSERCDGQWWWRTSGRWYVYTAAA